MNIGYYKKITNLKRDNEIPIDILLESIRNGKWQDETIAIRGIENKQERKFAKEKLPSVTLSGLFISRLDKESEQHSGYIGMDLDDLKNPEEIKDLLRNDPYIYSIFVTVGGFGLCVIFKTNPKKKHREEFYSIAKYLYDKYQIVVDPSGINESRIRYVSWDPNIFIRSGNVKVFDIKYEKEKKEKIPDVVFSKDDFDRILHEIEEAELNLCQQYREWLRIGFAFAHEFKENGREYFHRVSKFSNKYIKRLADLQYDACLKADGFNTTTISTFYFYCKQAGIKIYSERTKIIAHSMKHGKDSGLSKEQIADNLSKFEGIELTPDELNAFFNSNARMNEDGVIEELEVYIRQNYSLKRNSISRYIENHDIAMKQKDYNTIFINSKKAIPEVNYELIDRLINSDYIIEYNPFLKFYEENKHLKSTGNIEKLFASIKTDNPEYLLKFGRKWLVSIIASIHGIHSPLMFVLCGSTQGTGKTEFFRRLLPKELLKYYAESKLDAGKDDEILMTQKLLIMDDEMGGKNKKEDKRLKELLSKQTFTLREPYGRQNVELNRIAVLCGTTNDEEILYDTTGNRRILPMYIYAINHLLYNAVDKTELFIEVFDLYLSGFDWQLSFEDVNELKDNTDKFVATSLESELIDKYFTPGETRLSSTEIKIHIEKYSGQKIWLDRLCKELKRKGFIQERKNIKGQKLRCYLVDEVNKSNNDNPANRF